MPYLKSLISILVTCALLYTAAGLALAPAPIAAEYWVGETMFIKRELIAKHSAQRKVIVAGGSATLFGVDTRQLGREIGRPSINLGYHYGLRLGTLLAEAEAAAAPGDIVVLHLENNLYCVREPTVWQLRNDISWHRSQWNELNLLQRTRAVWAVGIPELVSAHVRGLLGHEIIRRRLAAADRTTALERYAAADHHAGMPFFAYSADNIDELGNMQGHSGSLALRWITRPEARTEVCPTSLQQLEAFTRRLASRDVVVVLASMIFVRPDNLDTAELKRAADRFARDVQIVAPLIDSRVDLLFEREHFFDVDTHLNTEGRRLRTAKLAAALLARPELRLRLGIPKS
jgi:hypothetical protein